MRATRLTVLTAAAALLGACATQEIRSGGGDVFLLQATGLNGSRAVERGLADARDFCAAQGRDFRVQDSRVGEGRYQLQFRCTAPFGIAAGGADPLLVAAATPVVREGREPAARRASRHAATQAPAPRRARTPRSGAPVAEAAPLEPLPVHPALPPRFVRPEPAPQGLPPVATTPLFNPQGASFPTPAARRAAGAAPAGSCRHCLGPGADRGPAGHPARGLLQQPEPLRKPLRPLSRRPG